MADAAIAGSGPGAASGWGVRLFRLIGESYAAEGERRLLWLPVFFGAGIGVYFSLSFEPPLWAGFGATFAAGIASFALHRRPLLCEAALALAVFCAGFALIGETTRQRQAPILQRRLGPVAVSGRIIDIDLLIAAGGSLSRPIRCPGSHRASSRRACASTSRRRATCWRRATAPRCAPCSIRCRGRSCRRATTCSARPISRGSAELATPTGRRIGWATPTLQQAAAGARSCGGCAPTCRGGSLRFCPARPAVSPRR